MIHSSFAARSSSVNSSLLATYPRYVSQFARFCDMTTNMILVVTFIYAATSISFLIDKNPGMAVCFAGYALANVGIIWSLP